MTATETYQQIKDDFDKTINALLGVKTIEEIHAERRMPGHVYHQAKAMHEYWIALSKYSVSADLSLLAFAINGNHQILPNRLQSRQDIVEFCKLFEENKDAVINALTKIIGNPNLLFIGYEKPITMQEYLESIVSDIHDEALNLEYNYKQFQSL